MTFDIKLIVAIIAVAIFITFFFLPIFIAKFRINNIEKASSIKKLLVGVASSSIASGISSVVVGIAASSYSIIELFSSFDLAKFSVRNLIPTITIVIVIVCVFVAIYYTPKQLRIAAGATVGFLCASYAYDGYIYAKDLIEQMAAQGTEVLDN